MVHEFGHHRQFRYLAETMLEVGQPFSKVKHEDGFGLMPDSSNWPEVQAARYEIQKLAPSQYGKSKTSEAFAEVWAGVTTGYVPISPELQSAWDTWHLGMEIPSQMPPDRFTPDELVDYESLLPEEKDEYWAGASALLELPGMREHYPETAAIYDAWAARTVYAANPNERKLGNGLVMRLSDSSEGRGTIEVRKDGDGELVGRLHWNLSGISHIGVTPDHQRQGIATAMYRWARELDPDLKHGMVVSETARSWIDTLNPEEREQVGRPETKFVGETPAPALMAPSASSNERSAKLAEKVADWLPKWTAKQEAIGYNTKIVSRYTVLNDILGKSLWGSGRDPGITPQDESIVLQVQHIVESGITPEQLREQAAQLRKAVLT
jgi:GNAT superfamily N-acetyltransferase